MVTLDKDGARELGREIAMFFPDLIVMIRRVLADPRVSQSAKLEAAAALAYLVSPRNRLTNLIPVVGQLDDVAIVAFAIRRLQLGAGEAVMREHWRGSDRAFQVMVGASAALSSPRGMVRKAKLAKALAGSTFDRLNGSSRRDGGQDGSGQDGAIRIVEGEIVDRTPEPAGKSPAGKSPAGKSPGKSSAGKDADGKDAPVPRAR